MATPLADARRRATALTLDKFKVKPGNRIILSSFNGVENPPKEVHDRENYWKLIGCTGIVIEGGGEKEFFDKSGRVCVKFDESVQEMNLECHNEIENSLWILESDLSMI